MRKAEATGVMLAEVIRRTRGGPFVLCGHSLGARVIFYALQELAGWGVADKVRAAHLFGGAVGTSPPEEWKRAASVVSGGLFNFYSTNDPVLKWLYSVGTGVLFSDPIGRNPISGVDSIWNIDSSRWVLGHSDYKAACGQQLWHPFGIG
jgi:pimeloyl-ACP methyl ester carboxylesterase